MPAGNHKPRPRRRIFAGKFTRRRLLWGAAATAAAGAAGVGYAIHRRMRPKRPVREIADVEGILRAKKLVRDPAGWARISMAYSWDPSTPHGIERIKFIESVSQKTRVSPGRIMRVIEQNPISAAQIKILNVDLTLLEGDAAKARFARDESTTEQQWNSHDSRYKNLLVRIEQGQGVIDVINALLSENEPLAQKIRPEVMKPPR